MANPTQCFENIITLNGGCSEAVSLSGITINDLGIDVQELDSYITKDYKSGEDLFNRKLSFAIKAITNLIHTHFSNYYKANTLLDGQRIGFVQENMVLNTGQGKWEGITIDMCNDRSIMDLYVSELSLFTDFTGNITVNVYDLLQNKIIDTIVVPSVANEIVSVKLQKTYQNNRKNMDLFFCYNTTGINNYSTYVWNFNQYGSGGGCYQCGGGRYRANPYMYAMGGASVIGTAQIWNAVTRSSLTAGMSLTYSLNCNHKEWLCTFAPSLALPILYYTAAQIMEAAIFNNTQLNIGNTAHIDTLKERKSSYENHFATHFDSVLKNIKLPTDKECYECRTPTRQAFAM